MIILWILTVKIEGTWFCFKGSKTGGRYGLASDATGKEVTMFIYSH